MLTLTPSQRQAQQTLHAFLADPTPHTACILRGYAGTGKTTLVAMLVRQLLQSGAMTPVLLAPTGRAAKVFANFAGHTASTIHKAIYRQQTFVGEDTAFSLGYNKSQNLLFIVDEASMIAAEDASYTVFGSGNVLQDLLQFAYAADKCKILFVGDTAQLPPIGEELSPALQAERLSYYGLNIYETTLTDVVRQAATSDILLNATHLRILLTEHSNPSFPLIKGSSKGSVRFICGNELIDSLISSYDKQGEDGTIIITRSNQRANIYNQGVRASIFDREDILTRGDRVMVVKNNYYWTLQARRELTPEEQRTTTLPDFLANGDMLEVVRIRNVHEQYGFTFADATLRLSDYDENEIDCRLLLSTLNSPAPALTREESQKLFNAIYEDYADIPSKRERMKRLREDAYYNALQLKYAYAVTCHKAQGGQWQHVYVDQGYVPEDSSVSDHLRWLYTAITRASDTLFLVNWPANLRTNSDEED